MNSGRQDFGAVDLIHLGLDSPDGRRCLLAATHQHDALYDVVVVILPGDAEARRVAFRDLGDVAHQDRLSVVGRYDRVANCVDGLDERDAAHDGGVRAEIQRVASDVLVVVVERLDYLRKRQPGVVQLVQVDRDLVGLALAAPPLTSMTPGPT